MLKHEHVEFWKISSEKEWEVTENLFEKKNYPQSLFFGHLTIEKILKAHWIKDNISDFPARTHNLVRLAGQTTLTLTPDDLIFLDKMNDFQMESRYPDYHFTIYQICTPEYSLELLTEINRIRLWLLSQLP
jgi:HEPN domain-containing protein